MLSIIPPKILAKSVSSKVTLSVLCFNTDSTNWPPDKKRKRSRWGGEETKPVGVASIIPSGLSKDQEKQVLCKYKPILLKGDDCCRSCLLVQFAVTFCRILRVFLCLCVVLFWIGLTEMLSWTLDVLGNVSSLTSMCWTVWFESVTHRSGTSLESYIIPSVDSWSTCT